MSKMSKIIVTYIGRRIQSDDTIGHYYLTPEGKRIGFKKKLGMCAVGSLVEMSYDGNTATGPFTYKGRVQDQAAYTEYRVADEAAQLEFETERMKKKVYETGYDRHVEALRQQYLALSGPQRLGFLVRVQRDIATR